jgi:hypothetical protein
MISEKNTDMQNLSQERLFYWVKGFHNTGSGHVYPLPLHVFFFLEIYEKKTTFKTQMDPDYIFKHCKF